ncbi:MAG TPA: DUF3429 family protein [Rhodopila sp.]|uniref:DUF3429 family protein n=1 Tax=Rhodopila sp. TaxID=2480087 RepID=UPI002B7BF8EA|nr:DUF3429 family protein [Rhodopila sp.]HVY15143.1 DUF3429 family protein [Rhodopila sp.]
MPVIVLLVAIVPFVCLGLGAVSAEAGIASRAMLALVDYAALVLTFSSAVHWVMGTGITTSRPAVRFAASLLGFVIAWAALLAAQWVGGPVAPAMLIFGYLVTTLTEHREARRSPISVRYLWLRWGISGMAAVTLALVLLMHGIGLTAVF